MVAAKFLTSRFLNREAVARTFRQIWRSSNGFKIRHLGDHLAHFVPYNSNDEDKTISNQLWSFDKHLVVLERYESDNPIRELVFTKAAFWVQVHDIPIRYMTRKVAESICETIGEVSRSIGVVDDDGGHFIRVRVIVDISLPLCRERVITLESGEKAWISFKYERLPNVCYWCGCLDHDNKNCNLWIQSKGTLTEAQQQFRPNLRARALPYQSTGKSVIFVPGYYERDLVHLQVNYSEEVDASAIRVEKVASTAVDSLDMETEDFGEGINDGNFLKKKKKKADDNGRDLF